MITQFYGNEIIQNLIKVDNLNVSLPAGSKIKLGGIGSILNSNLNLNTAITGVGGMESGIQAVTLYYVYVVLDGTVEKLIATTSSIKPSSFNNYRKVGAFYTDSNSDILVAYYFGDNIGFDEVDATNFFEIVDASNANVESPSPSTNKMVISRVRNIMKCSWSYYHQSVVGAVGSGVYGVKIPYGLTATNSILSGGNSPLPYGKAQSDIGGGTHRSWYAFLVNSSKWAIWNTSRRTIGVPHIIK